MNDTKYFPPLFTESYEKLVTYENLVPRVIANETGLRPALYGGISNKFSRVDSSAASIASDSLERVFAERYAREEFRRNLLRLLALEPIEDGYEHPSEGVIENAWKQYRTVFSEWIQSVYIENIHNSTIASGILRCVGRLPRERVQPWGIVMAISGLYHSDIELREAAVRALELWGGRESLYALKSRIEVETVPWLADYIKEVIEDLSK